MRNRIRAKANTISPDLGAEKPVEPKKVLRKETIDDFVARVSVEVAPLPPGVTLVDEKEAVQAVGRPEQDRETAVS